MKFAYCYNIFLTTFIDFLFIFIFYDQHKIELFKIY